jgi:hypothetical protein
MEAPTLPDGLQQALAEVRSGLRLFWNTRAKVARAGSYDAFGIMREGPKYDGRWELWDTDPDGAHYKVTMVQEPDGSYRAPGFWLVELLNYMHPARFGGSVEKLAAELIDKPNAAMLEVDDKQFEDLAEMAARWHVWADQPKVAVSTNLN